METSYRRLTPEQWKQADGDAAVAASLGLFTADSLEDCDDEELEEILDALAESERYLDIGKLWDGLYYLFNRRSGIMEADSLELFALPINGGADTKFEASYGRVRFLTVAEVERVAGALDTLDEERLRSQFDPEEMNREKVYPGTWSERDWNELLKSFQSLRQFFRIASDGGEVILISRD